MSEDGKPLVPYLRRPEEGRLVVQLAEVPAFLPIGEQTLQALASTGSVPHWRSDGGLWFDLRKLRRWMSDQFCEWVPGRELDRTVLVLGDGSPRRLPHQLLMLRESLVEIERVPVFSCVYFLCLGEEIVYVGQASNGWRRASEHAELGKDFDRSLALPCSEAERGRLEVALIKTLRPRLNKENWLASETTDEERAIARAVGVVP